MNADMRCVYASIGSMGVLSGLLAFRMSLYRVAGSPGEDKEDSDLTNMYWTQQLNAEWVPVGVGLGLALVAKGTMQKCAVARNLLALFCLSRWVFVAARLGLRSNPMPLAFPSMMTTYAATFGMSAMLMLPGTCA